MGIYFRRHDDLSPNERVVLAETQEGGGHGKSWGNSTPGERKAMSNSESGEKQESF